MIEPSDRASPVPGMLLLLRQVARAFTKPRRSSRSPPRGAKTKLKWPRLCGNYVDVVTGALGQYTCDILDMVEEGHKVWAKLRYHGYHRGELLGFPATGRHVWWYGTPLFTFEGGKVRDLWVLGDVHGLLQKLAS
jgi:SnoaL-like polyketide cyclase